YYNQAIYFFNSNQYRDSYNCIEKAWLLYPSERIRFTMLQILAEIVNERKYDDINELKYFIRICRYTNEITIENVRDEFIAITYKYLITNSNVEYYDQIYNYLISGIQNKQYLDEISFIYYYEKVGFAQ
ncbi:MAG: hypothetical protein HC906_09840, partial [Bacteroidales bacterium]|nr:hypothetical protein [Bacteroidales bacterium]